MRLIVDDPDAPDPKAPRMTWVHWVLYNLPPDSRGLEESVRQLPAGTRQGVNDWKRTGYGGPCPPIGRHRYFHKLYALDRALDGLGAAGKKQLQAAMDVADRRDRVHDLFVFDEQVHVDGLGEHRVLRAERYD